MHPMTLRLLVVAAALAAADAHAAPEFRASYGSWRYDLSGTVTQDNTTYDLRDDLEVEASGRRSIAIEWDTPAGWWPDLAVSFTQLGAAGYHEETFTVFDILGNPVGQQTETITTAADFDDLDVTARYPLPLEGFDLAVGVAVKRLRGEVLIDDSSQPAPSRERYAETVPELYGGVRWPLTGWLTLAGSAQGISAGGSSALEWRATAGFKLKALLLEAGWQEKRYELDLEGRALDVRLGGALARVGLVFR